MVLDSIKFLEDIERDRIRSCFQAPGYDAFPALVIFSQVLLDPGIDAVFESPPKEIRGELLPGLLHCGEQGGGHLTLVEPAQPPEDLLGETSIGDLGL